MRERLARWCEQRAKHDPSPALELSVAIAVCVGAAVFGAVRDNPAVLASGATGAVFLVGLVVVATRRRRARLAGARGPWHAPEGGWQVCESSIFARSIVGAASGDEDYSQWTLFEIPGGTWLFVEPLALPDPSVEEPGSASDPQLRELGARDLIPEDALPAWMRAIVRKG